MMNGQFKRFRISAIRKAKAALSVRERDARLPSDTVQWLYWAAHNSYESKFESLMDILEVVKTRALTNSERGLLIDALAIGSTNVTPSRVQWTFKWAPKDVRMASQSHVNFERLQESVEEAVIGATPVDPSSDANYDKAWRNFPLAELKASNAYFWSLR